MYAVLPVLRNTVVGRGRHDDGRPAARRLTSGADRSAPEGSGRRAAL
ncbi:hypothetical protein QTQ03_01210 [Micromonospora sp. WMMA1363]|nr:hypothetical protein [Micromonospora sp. WMMA1363]MDM4718268.1 hypothetical protein [Micromonospora sp. WMMA1363]